MRGNGTTAYTQYDNSHLSVDLSGYDWAMTELECLGAAR